LSHTTIPLAPPARLNTSEVRGAVITYHSIRDLLDHQALDKTTRQHLSQAMNHIESACWQVTNHSDPARWARKIVGPVLSAALGASGWMGGRIPSALSALQMFGLEGPKPLSAQQAWDLLKPYAKQQTIPHHVIEKIQKESGLKFKLAENPSPADVLLELTRSRSGDFAVRVGRWIADHFRANANADNIYAEAYRTALAQLHTANQNGELEHSSTLSLSHRLDREAIEKRASYTAVVKFIVDYWERWQRVIAQKQK
jgi:hypothetical protein